METTLPQTAAPPLYIHHHEAEVTFRCGDEVRTLGPGGFV